MDKEIISNMMMEIVMEKDFREVWVFFPSCLQLIKLKQNSKCPQI